MGSRDSDQEARAGRELAAATRASRFQLQLELAVAYRARGRLSDALREFDAAVDQLAAPSADVRVLRALTLERGPARPTLPHGVSSAWTLRSREPVKAYYVLQRRPQRT